MDWTLALGALVVGIVVGLTGMGGGALMTPMLVLLFGVSPLAAVSSDLVASAVMKPVGSFVHIRNGTVRLGPRPLAVHRIGPGRVLRGADRPARSGSGQNVEDIVQNALGVALIIAATGLFFRAYHAAGRAGRAPRRPPRGRPEGPAAARHRARSRRSSSASSAAWSSA